MTLAQQADGGLDIVGDRPDLDGMGGIVPEHILGVPVEGVAGLTDAAGLEEIAALGVDGHLPQPQVPVGQGRSLLLVKAEVMGMAGKTERFGVGGKQPRQPGIAGIVQIDGDRLGRAAMDASGPAADQLGRQLRQPGQRLGAEEGAGEGQRLGGDEVQAVTVAPADQGEFMVAHDRDHPVGPQGPDHLLGFGTVADGVAQGDDPLHPQRGKIGQDRLQGPIVAMDVGDDRQPHGTRL